MARPVFCPAKRKVNIRRIEKSLAHLKNTMPRAFLHFAKEKKQLAKETVILLFGLLYYAQQSKTKQNKNEGECLLWQLKKS